jgi:hypothetical protein
VVDNLKNCIAVCFPIFYWEPTALKLDFRQKHSEMIGMVC